MPYIHFTEEQKQQANSVDLVDFLQRQGEQLIRSGREWRWKRYDSVTVRGNKWFRHSCKEGGRAIDFVQQFFDMSFPDAVSLLLGGESGVEWNQTAKTAPPPGKAFDLPEASPNMRRVFAYLIKQRFIDREVLSHFAHEKLIYEDKEYHNAVFVGLDENGIPRHAHKRGTYTKGNPYKGNVEGSDPRYSFHWIGEDDTLYVFEAPVDMLSFITLQSRDWKKHSYVTLDGVSEHALLQQLKLNRHLKNIVLCLDHDMAGIEATGRLQDILTEQQYFDSSSMEFIVMQSQNKDWNEDLKAIHGITPIPARKHPKLEILPQLCRELLTTCESLLVFKNPDNLLQEFYQKLKPTVESGKITAVNSELVKAYLHGIASASLLVIQKLYKQMERPVTLDQLIDKIQKSYRPHQDHGWLRSKVEDIKFDVLDINRQVHTVGIRTIDDTKKLICSYSKLVLDCVKTQLLIELEITNLISVQERNTSNLTMGF